MMDLLQDRNGRRIQYVRVAVTDRCNFRCQYCMPPDGVPWVPHQEILRYEELLRVLSLLTGLGVEKVRITGGEPLLRKGVVDFIGQVVQLPGVKEVSLTTNAALLADFAPALYSAGVRRVNISLDTLQPERFGRITGRDELPAVLRGIAAAEAAGLAPLKLNMVVMQGINDDEVVDMARLTLDKPYEVRFIEYMPIGRTAAAFLPATAIKKRLAAAGLGALQPVNEPMQTYPAERFRLPGAPGLIGFISPVSRHFCATCNRLRITPDGALKPCLLADAEYPLRTWLRSGCSDETLIARLRQVVAEKPSRHHLRDGQSCERGMSRIGG